MFVQIVCVCFTCISSFFSLEAVSPAFVLPLAAILIVEAFVFAFVVILGFLRMLLIIKLELAITIALKRRCEV